MICESEGHDFMAKRQHTGVGLNGIPNEQNVTELFCRKCGTVCLLNSTPPRESEGVN